MFTSEGMKKLKTVISSMFATIRITVNGIDHDFQISSSMISVVDEGVVILTNFYGGGAYGIVDRVRLMDAGGTTIVDNEASFEIPEESTGFMYCFQFDVNEV